MNRLSSLLLSCAVLFCTSCKDEAVVEYYPNLYWPGDFEQGLYGGNFSKSLNVQLTDAVNATPDGRHSWYLPPKTNQHLELLTEGSGDFKVSFKGKATGELQLFIKVVYKDENDSVRTNDIPVLIPGDNTWHDFTVDYSIECPYPGPRTGEFLISCYNPGVEAWIDDVDVRRTSPDTVNPYFEVDPELVTNRIRNGNFNEGFGFWITEKNDRTGDTKPLAKKRVVQSDSKPIAGSSNKTALMNLDINAYLRLGHMDGAIPSISQSISAEALAGKQIRISADIAFETIDEEGASSWSGILITLQIGNNGKGDIIASDPQPNWYPLGLASPPGQFKKIHATYIVPDDARVIYLTIQAMKNMGSNTAMIDNIVMEVLD